MSVPYHVAATALKQIIDTEFAVEQFTAVHDKLHESLGDRRVEIGLSPIREVPMPGNAVVQHGYILVQFYGLWQKEISNETAVNPFEVTAYADRFRRAVERSHVTVPGSDEVWYFVCEGIEYPDDPTGNKSRFEATIKTYGNNTGLVESLS